MRRNFVGVAPHFVSSCDAFSFELRRISESEEEPQNIIEVRPYQQAKE